MQTGAGSAPWAVVTVDAGGLVGTCLQPGAEGLGGSLPSPASLAGSPRARSLAERLAVTSETSQGAQRSGALEKELAVTSKGTSEAED